MDPRYLAATAALLVTGCLPSAAQPAGPPRGAAQNPQQGYSLDQAISDNAQRHTIAFDGMAFLSGDFASSTFLPPGKVCDYFGFQYLRDIQPQGGGHNTSFLTRIADNVLTTLDDAQKARFVALAHLQAPQFRDFAVQRFPLIAAFYRQLQGKAPAGSALAKAAVVKYSADLWALDGQLAYDRAVLFGRTAASLSAAQKATLAKLPFGNWRAWPETGEGLDRRTLPHDVHVAVMTYASEFYSWYAGSLEGDVYFCPERHATYFGSFYVKDKPVMHRENAAISTSRTGDGGEQFLAALTPTQRSLVTGLVDQQRGLLKEMVTVRRAIATELRRSATGGTPDHDQIIALSRRYGELDGEMSYDYAVAFAAVGGTLTAEQAKAVAAIRQLPAEPNQPAYLYSEPIAAPAGLDTDFLFAPRRG